MSDVDRVMSGDGVELAAAFIVEGEETGHLSAP
jgi:hypothetical protein